MASAAVDELTGVDIFDPEADLTRTNFLFPIFLKADVDLVMAELPASALELAFSVTGVAKPEVDPAGTGVDFEVEDGVSALTRTNFFVPIILKRLFDFLVLLVDPLEVVAAALVIFAVFVDGLVIVCFLPGLTTNLTG